MTTPALGSSIMIYIVERELVCIEYLCHRPPPTSLIEVVKSGSFHWASSLFIYFCLFHVWLFAFMLQVTLIKKHLS